MQRSVFLLNTVNQSPCLDTIIWRSYDDAVLETLPPFCLAGSQVWQSRTILVCFHIIELRHPDPVLRQFGLLQHIPEPVLAIPRINSRGRADEDWAAYHASYIERWNDRLVDIAEVAPETDPDPIRATTVYMQWYWTITRRWISRPVQRPPLAYQPRGHVERVLVDIVQRSHYTIRRVLPDISGGGVLATLSQVADQMEAVLETLPTLPHYVPPGPADYGGASTSGHAPVYSPPMPSSPIGEPPYADVTDPAPAPVPQDPARAGDIVYFRRRRRSRSIRTDQPSSSAPPRPDQPSSSAPPRPDILPAHATAVIEPVIEGAAIEHLDQLEILEPFDEHDVGRGRGRGRRRGRGGRGRRT
ncbi:serine/threonine-protein phosphatase 7 long form homolog [Ananas comosus]|uniref:Serine/threonine-protein phosphatase 7 long form homolog n=1 Tax=Ananas comosus TaxID=4615 RepID=A0A6P5GMQ2_ANACO|nr:serine/threonine-protein phosphatase 7 long form homolog [Ananas comosus]